MLYVTFAKNLPRIGRSLDARLAPSSVNRIEFTGPYLLAERNVPYRLNGDGSMTLLTKA